MIYSYIIDNNEYYPEDHSQATIFSLEKLDNEEFETIVQKAYELCGDFPYYEKVAEKIIEIDNRFFVPECVSYAFIGHEEEDFNCKIRGFHHK